MKDNFYGPRAIATIKPQWRWHRSSLVILFCKLPPVAPNSLLLALSPLAELNMVLNIGNKLLATLLVPGFVGAVELL
jgi:hypothetical protein